MELREVLIEILELKSLPSQKAIVKELAERGFVNINQSKLSRILGKLGAVRIKTPSGDMAYTLSSEMAVPQSDSKLQNLVLSIEHNTNLVVIRTTSGAAMLIARIVDSLPNLRDLNIMGVVAGDDTLMVIPCKVGVQELDKLIDTLYNQINGRS